MTRGKQFNIKTYLQEKRNILIQFLLKILGLYALLLMSRQIASKSWLMVIQGMRFGFWDSKFFMEILHQIICGIRWKDTLKHHGDIHQERI